MKKIIISACLLLSLSFTPLTFADDGIGGTAVGIPIAEKNIKDGEIISAVKGGYKRATLPYDPSMFGIVSLEPAVYLEDESVSNQTPVVTLGKVKMRVSTVNGSIKKGDLVTSSKIPGVGQKATENGMVIGTAEEDYAVKDPNKISEITVTLNPHFGQITNNITRNALSALRTGFGEALQTPNGSLRYIVAGFVALMSFFFGFRFFATTSRSGVEAIGRNPLASKSILLSVFINTTITISIMLLGVAIGYMILVF